MPAEIVLTQQSKIQFKGGHQFLGVLRELLYIKIDFNALIEPAWENIAVLGRLLTDGKIIFLQVYVGSVILDEATSSVDPENEHLLLAAIRELTAGKTLISIAHRLSTVRDADQIVVVDQGRIVQQGTHDALMAQDGLYRRFVQVREQAEGWRLE